MGRLDHFEKSNAFIMEATVVTLSTSAEIETAIYLDPVITTYGAPSCPEAGREHDACDG